jgi:hypothetical protein
MTKTQHAPVSIADLADLIEDGRRQAAKAYARRFLDQTPTKYLALAADCTKILDEHGAAGLDRLRQWYKQTDPIGRQVIYVCAVARAQVQPQHTAQPTAPAQPEPQPTTTRRSASPQRTRAQRAAHRVSRAEHNTRAYLGERGPGGKFEEPRDQRAPSQPYASELDFDRAAMHALRHLPCLVCNVERAQTDWANPRCDDGLCAQHRATMPALAGNSPADIVRAVCRHLVDEFGDQARDRIRLYWQAAVYMRDPITAWVKLNHPAWWEQKQQPTVPAPESAAAPTATPNTARTTAARAGRRSTRRNGPTKSDLLRQAQRAGIRGLSKMNKAQLVEALGHAAA